MLLQLVLVLSLTWMVILPSIVVGWPKQPYKPPPGFINITSCTCHNSSVYGHKYCGFELWEIFGHEDPNCHPNSVYTCNYPIIPRKGSKKLAGGSGGPATQVNNCSLWGGTPFCYSFKHPDNVGRVTGCTENVAQKYTYWSSKPDMEDIGEYGHKFWNPKTRSVFNPTDEHPHPS